MKFAKTLQIIGIVLFVTGFIARIGFKLFLDAEFSDFLKEFQLLKFVGFVFWGVGFVLREVNRKKVRKLKVDKKNPSKV